MATAAEACAFFLSRLQARVSPVPNKQYLQNIPLSALREWDKNYRSITPQALLRLKNKIQALGVFKPLLAVAGAEKGTYQIIGGNQRLRAYRELGFESADIIFFPDLTDKKIIAKIALADNQSDGFTEPEKLLALCQDADLTLDDLDDFALSDADLKLQDIFPDETSSVYEDEPPAVEEGRAFSRPGDFYVLGRHRLICGDSTQAETWARLMGKDKKADLLLTDPPYNVDYESASGKKIANDCLSPAEFRAFIAKALRVAGERLKDGGGFYIWHADKEAVAFHQACEAAGLDIKQVLVWNKNHFVLGRQDYQWKHEPCLYGWKRGAAHYFTDNRKQATVFEDALPDWRKMKKEDMVRLLEQIFGGAVSTTVLDEDKPLCSAEHPTMKPVRLLARLISNSTRQEETVSDPFGGSGSTLIACEQLNRVCFTAEMEAHYCDVIVKRFARLKSGGKIELWRGGKKTPCEALLAEAHDE